MRLATRYRQCVSAAIGRTKRQLAMRFAYCWLGGGRETCIEQCLPNAKGSSPEGIVLCFVPSTKGKGYAYHTAHILLHACMRMYVICIMS